MHRFMQQQKELKGLFNFVTGYLYLSLIAQFTITINSNVCPYIRVPNMLMRESYA